MATTNINATKFLKILIKSKQKNTNLLRYEIDTIPAKALRASVCTYLHFICGSHSRIRISQMSGNISDITHSW